MTTGMKRREDFLLKYKENWKGNGPQFLNEAGKKKWKVGDPLT